MADFGKATFSVKVDTGPLVEMVQRAIDSIELLDRAVIIWRWEDAPEEYRTLSTHGGDEDWVALVPAGDDYWPAPFSESGDYPYFGGGDIYQLESGERVVIFAHA